MAITTEMIKTLRESTGAGILDCRKALEQSNGDLNAALDFLREKGLATATKRSARQASEGVVELYSHGNGRVGVMVELNSESDFVGRSEVFRTLAHEIALQIAATSPEFVAESDIPASVIERETKIATAKAKEDGKPDSILPKIVEGSIKKFKDEFVLMNQNYIRDESITIQELINQKIAALGENIIVRRFARWALGETTAEASEE
ncbi:MAG: translation elongation factor Ts [Anaerolinea sp.]|nr:translation elongation factor Ts [Anaerolinea sp.]